MEENKDLIESVLKHHPQDIAFEPIPQENDSPLAQPVVQKSNTSGDVNASKNEANANSNSPEKKEEQQTKTNPEPTDAPEQEIDAEPTEEEKKTNQSLNNDSEFSMSLEHAGLVADSILGTVNNTILEVGAGYFVTIRKHKDFYDFEEVVQIIDEQNVKNIKRIKLDEEDRMLLRPILAEIIRKKAVAISPEKQLIMVIISIVVKKSKAIMEIRAENELLVERIRDIIYKEVRGYEKEQESSQEKKDNQNGNQSEEAYGDHTNPKKTNQTGLPDSVLETAA